MSFKHVVLTRWSVPFRGKQLDDNWLFHRSFLFERFCLPSLKAQTCQDFKWLVFFDSRSPEWFRHTVMNKWDQYENFVPLFVDNIHPETYLREISEILEPSDEWVITTRMDNDDALARWFVERVQSEFRGRREFLHFRSGWVWYKNKIHLRVYTNNPFLSLVEPVNDVKAVWSVKHPQVQTAGDVRELAANPAWLQVCHDRNVGNKPGDLQVERVDESLLNEEFGLDMDIQIPRVK